ncbi:UDP-2,3-diacylglucosamine diphosphatase [Candidatus Kinetoplastidibacterium crithidiae]|uniref:UDP-2,3-diacylglucosamine hydrolase n=1 Tax=Candidatus Kinetoplastidibacterium crithidiae TCC036E TaxID=1208918 RepID=M1LTM4_9PROT|nr:UDP-2,3-diacylglucosamine diphosphatase [Candidatus Kinetoplastibacterium crithidii]AFZ83180.1 UDP-2,3-diacylglucosamine hydrolase [Candidatus Kinetoplastibacterium crithidii (ex Angomonas deanei ATCC 30255)]AGF47456.1 UDP-2,3-diacylglucosamine hydrolase [Candidatus Kinetoplastibacterium crithidii TCC036E]
MSNLILKGSLWFASDFHLSENHYATLEAFKALIHEASSYSDALLLLGDVFDIWIGDDVINLAPEWLEEILFAMKQATRKIPVFLVRGNRDFLLGKEFSSFTGIKLISSQTIINTDFKTIIVTHGDELCTDDLEYQKFKMLTNNENWKKQFLYKPIEERLSLASSLRNYSNINNKSKPNDIMDINESELLRVFDSHKVQIMIHGHTHKKGKVNYNFKNSLCERWVLPEWDLDDKLTKQGKIILDSNGIRFA